MKPSDSHSVHSLLIFFSLSLILSQQRKKKKGEKKSCCWKISEIFVLFFIGRFRCVRIFTWGKQNPLDALHSMTPQSDILSSPMVTDSLPPHDPPSSPENITDHQYRKLKRNLKECLEVKPFILSKWLNPTVRYLY
jgi:hypothetical protein